jgi:hypothetical protein
LNSTWMDEHPLASTVPRTEPPRTASALKRFAAVAGVALSAGARPLSRNDGATETAELGRLLVRRTRQAAARAS